METTYSELGFQNREGEEQEKDEDARGGRGRRAKDGRRDLLRSKYNDENTKNE